MYPLTFCGTHAASALPNRGFGRFPGLRGVNPPARAAPGR
jgi:hypothetical protein